MKKMIFTLLTALFVSFTVSAQFEPTTGDDSSSSKNSKNARKSSSPVKQPINIKEKIVVGGGVDLRFGDITVVGLTPLVGYKITDKLLAGSNFTYRYIQYNYLIPTYSTSTYGIAPFLRYSIFRGLFAHAEYEFLYGEFRYQDDPRWINSLLVGGGYGTPIGSNGFIGAYILWNLTPSADPNYRIYEAPQLRLSFGVGL